MNTFFEFEENFSFEDEFIPGLADFYRDYAIAIIRQAGIRVSERYASFKCVVNYLEQLAAQDNIKAKDLLADIYRDNLVARTAA